jgi:hypothetical protein
MTKTKILDTDTPVERRVIRANYKFSRDGNCFICVHPFKSVTCKHGSGENESVATWVRQKHIVEGRTK